MNQQPLDAKRDAFLRKPTQALEMTSVRGQLNKLVNERRKKTWDTSEERALDQTIQKVNKENTQLLAEENTIARRARKYQFFPAKAQERMLKRYMSTCR